MVWALVFWLVDGASVPAPVPAVPELELAPRATIERRLVLAMT